MTARRFDGGWRDIDGINLYLDSRARLPQTVIISVLAALLSVLFTGSVFGVDNHVFHLPIIHDLYNEDQFRNDAFIQSLRHYSSGIWLLLSGSSAYAGDGRWLFAVLLYASRLLSFAAILSCAVFLGVRTIRQQSVFSLIICFTAILDGTSFAGHGGLFVRSFGHSEIAVGALLFAISFAVRGRIAIATIWAGATFFVNAFMGVWLVAPLGAIVASLLVRGKIAIRSLLFQMTAGGLAAAAFAAPVLYNIFSNPDFGKKFAFDYPAYLREYYGGHFFVDASPLYELILLICLAYAGWIAFSRLDSHRREFRAALAGAVALYGFGVFVSIAFSSALILNLHLLRSGLMVHCLAAIALAALATKWLTSGEAREATVLGPYLLFSLCVRYLFPASIGLIAWSDRIKSGGGGLRDDKLRITILVALLVVILPWRAWQNVRANSMLQKAADEWEMVARWAASSTAADAMFMTPMIGPNSAISREAEALVSASSIFESASHRRVWADHKRGAAVMWQPSYYEQWHSRVWSMLDLQTLEDRRRYAHKNGIDYVIQFCGEEEAGTRLTYRSSHLCVY
jgi:hypothetical protein